MILVLLSCFELLYYFFPLFLCIFTSFIRRFIYVSFNVLEYIYNRHFEVHVLYLHSMLIIQAYYIRNTQCSWRHIVLTINDLCVCVCMCVCFVLFCFLLVSWYCIGIIVILYVSTYTYFYWCGVPFFYVFWPLWILGMYDSRGLLERKCLYRSASFKGNRCVQWRGWEEF